MGLGLSQAEVDLIAKTDQCEVSPTLGFEIASIGIFGQNEGDKEGQGEIKDGCVLMFKTVIQRPMDREGVKEEVVLDLPGAVANIAELAGRKVGDGKVVVYHQ